MVIVSCAYTERSYPAIAIEVQGALGIVGFGFDMLVACSAATFALQRAHDALAAGSARGVLVINPELTSPQVNYCDRDSHFIFGDVATAVVLEHESTCVSQHSYRILGTKAVTQFSNNIRSNFGYVGRAEGGDPYDADRLFHQNGRKVFKEVCPMAAAHLEAQVTSLGLGVSDITALVAASGQPEHESADHAQAARHRSIRRRRTDRARSIREHRIGRVDHCVRATSRRPAARVIAV